MFLSRSEFFVRSLTLVTELSYTGNISNYDDSNTCSFKAGPVGQGYRIH